MNLLKDKLVFLPLLCVYVLIVLAANNDSLFGDEGRYIMYATNLLNGFYSPQDTVSLHNGPGYPIVLMPFVKLKLPWLAARLMNPVFLFSAIIYFYFTLRIYMKERSALLFSYLLGLYIPFWKGIALLLTECLAIFLVCAFMFHFCKLLQESKKTLIHLLIASVYLGYLALTKVFFGYVILIGILLSLILYIWRKKHIYKKTVLVYSLALLVCVPYLSYTYLLTGKVFYWGHAGGENLYYMSSPYPGELGDWAVHGSKFHREFHKELAGLSTVEQDAKFKQQAVRNIINHPVKYSLNWVSNIGRLFFNYPRSYDIQRLSNLFYFIPNMFLVVVSVLCLFPAFQGRKQIPYEIYTMILFLLISLGGLSIQSCDHRYLWPLVPIFMLLISFTLTRFVNIEMQH